jgi:hypothetical protein
MEFGANAPGKHRQVPLRTGSRPAGVWLVRQGALKFALPITTGTKPGVADYLPAPHGLPGFDVPVEQTVPAMVPYLELADGHVYVAGDGADEIQPASDGRSLRVVWKHWAMIGAKSGVPSDLGSSMGLTTEVSWTIAAGTLTRTEKIQAAKPVTVRRFWVMFPSTADRVSTSLVAPDSNNAGHRVDRFASSQGSLEVAVSNSTVPLNVTLQAPGDSNIGRGSRLPVRMLLQWEARNVVIQSNRPLQWSVALRPVAE